MENLHLKNLDLEKVLKKSKLKNLPEQIKSHIPIDEEDTEDNKNVIFESSVKLLMIGWVAVGLTFAFTHPYFVIEIGRSLYKFGELIFGL
jgi:hypothetical protein